jgi:hypothetical protein
LTLRLTPSTRRGTLKLMINPRTVRRPCKSKAAPHGSEESQRQTLLDDNHVVDNQIGATRHVE